MSTRANIIIKDNYDKLFFYRHSDGYPEGTMPSISIFMEWVKSGKIRNNAQQAAGWLILLGAMEYNTIPNFETDKPFYEGGRGYAKMDTIQQPEDWKAGAYEPTTCIHGDIEYLYIIDLEKKTVKCFEDWTDEGEGKGSPVKIN